MQNYLIDTGDEVILVDTGLSAGTPEEVPDENSPIFTGKDICSYTALHRNMVSSITQVISERIDQTRPVLFLIGQGKHLWTQQAIAFARRFDAMSNKEVAAIMSMLNKRNEE